jgi:hypothetical protein
VPLVVPPLLDPVVPLPLEVLVVLPAVDPPVLLAVVAAVVPPLVPPVVCPVVPVPLELLQAANPIRAMTANSVRISASGSCKSGPSLYALP